VFAAAIWQAVIGAVFPVFEAGVDGAGVGGTGVAVGEGVPHNERMWETVKVSQLLRVQVLNWETCDSIVTPVQHMEDGEKVLDVQSSMVPQTPCKIGETTSQVETESMLLLHLSLK